MRPKSPIRTSLLVCAIACAGACAGCSDLVRASRLEPGGVNVESPAAGVVLAAESRRTAYPSFRDVPPKPSNMEPPARVAEAVTGLKGERGAFRTWESDNPLTTSDTPGFADAARTGVQAQSPAAPPADQVQVSTDWAKRARDAAKAPFAAPSKP